MQNLRDDVDAETEEVLNEFSFLGSDTDDASHELRVQTDTTDWGKSILQLLFLFTRFFPCVLVYQFLCLFGAFCLQYMPYFMFVIIHIKSPLQWGKALSSFFKISSSPAY